MEKRNIFGIVMFLIVLSSFPVFGQNAKYPVFESEFISSGKFTIEGTLSSPYNEGQFHKNDGVQGVFGITVDTIQETCVDLGFIDTLHGEMIHCFNETICLTSAIGEIYGSCTIPGDSLEHIGHYFLYINTTGYDDNFYVLETVEVIHSKPSGLMWVFGILTILGLITAFIMKEGYLTVISLFFFLGFVIEATLRVYRYIFQYWGGIITGIIVLILVLIITFFMNEWDKK